MSKCLSEPIGLGCAPADGEPVHAHDDESWWFWTETWCDEEGPYPSKEQAVEALKLYVKEFLQ